MTARVRGLLVAGFVMAGLVACTNSRGPQSSLYRDIEAGFELRSPSGWSLIHGFGDTRLLVVPDADNLATRVAISWDQRRDSVTPTLEEYAAYRVPRLAHFGKDRALIQRERLPMNHQQSDAIVVEYVYSIGQPAQEIRARAWLLVSSRGQYLVTLTAPDAEFARHEAIWAGVAANFQLLN